MRCLLLLLALPLAAQESKVEIDNTWVRVLRVKLAPHAKLPAEARLPSVTVFLTDAGRQKADDVSYSEAARSSDENATDHELEKIVVELKPNAPKSPPLSLDPVKLDPEHHLVPLENARVRVLRTILEPHLKSPLHEHPHYVVVYLTELHTTMALADGKLVDNVRRPGEVAWRDYMKHQTENIGDKQAVEIQIELK
jgi:quercetin dioxygenase-like cupin family protein